MTSETAAGGARPRQRFDAAEVAAREADILGPPPRILPLSEAEIGEAAQDNALRLLKGATGAAPPSIPFAAIPEIVPTLMRHPRLWERICDLSVQLLGGGVLRPRDRQLAVLRLLWLCQAPYAWGEHVKHGHKAGLTTEEVERVTQGSAAPGWSEAEQAILAAAEELHATAMIGDATWETLARHLDEQQLFELTVVIGQFTTVAYFQNALRLRLGAGNAGLQAR